MKNKIGNLFFDLDEMKFGTLSAQVAYTNHRWNTETTIDDHIGQNHKLEELVRKHTGMEHLTRDEVYIDFGRNFLASIDWHKQVQPMPYMQEVMHDLAQKYTLYTVTARQEISLPVIKYLLDTHIPGCITHIHCVYGRINNQYIEKPKKDFIASIKGDNLAFFDDSLSEIRNMQNVIRSYLYDPTNRHEHENDIQHRISSWEEIGKLYL